MRKLKWVVTAVASTALGLGAASAADLPVKAPSTKAPVVTIYDWTGFYFGANAGVGLGRDFTRHTLDPIAEASYLSPLGAVGGVQAGYNWQFSGPSLLGGPLVLGVEADIQGSGMRDDGTCLTGCLPLAGNKLDFRTQFDQRLDWFGTVRGRIGIASGPVLSYLTAGYAYGGVKTSVIQIAGAPAQTFTTNGTRSGWTWGSGVEASLGGNWTGKIEYLYIDLGGRLDLFTLNTIPQSVSTDIREQIFRVGVNYRIGGSGAAYMPPPPSNWAGFYLGGNIGSGTARDPSSLVSTGRVNEQFNLSPDGVIGGAQAGYNWQAANWVFGLEADIQGSSQRDNRACVSFCGSPNAIGTVMIAYDATLPWFGTARVRLGYSAGSTLFYATGGFAYGNIKTRIDGLFFEPTHLSFSHDKSGWTVGGGIETPFTLLGLLGPNWTSKVEYLYVDLGSVSDSFTQPAIFNTVATIVTSTRVQEHIFRSGLNYHFSAPVIAKY
jgi:outer membrane immunogenic protein